MNTVGQAALIFVITVITDFFFGRYTITCAQRKAIPASAWSSVYTVSYATIVIQYVHTPWLIMVVAMGSGIGTYMSIRFN